MWTIEKGEKNQFWWNVWNIYIRSLSYSNITKWNQWHYIILEFYNSFDYLWFECIFALLSGNVEGCFPLVHFKRLGSRGFHDLLIIIYVSFQNIMNTAKQYCKTFWWIFPYFWSDVVLMIYINIKCQWDFIMGKTRS